MNWHVVVLCGEHERFLAGAVDSAIEAGAGLVTIVLNACQDTSPMVASELGEEHGDLVRIIVNATGSKLGYARARNLGASEAEARFLCFMRASDKLGAWALQEAAGRLQGSDVVYQDAFAFGVIAQYEPAPDNAVELLDEVCAISDAAMMRADLYDRLGGFDEEAEPWAGWDFWLRARAAGASFVRLRGLVYYRRELGDGHGELASQELSAAHAALRARHPTLAPLDRVASWRRC